MQSTTDYEKRVILQATKAGKQKKLLFIAHVSIQSYPEWHGMATA